MRQPRTPILSPRRRSTGEVVVVTGLLVAVDKAGTAAIKGLIIDGKLQYEEPLL